MSVENFNIIIAVVTAVVLILNAIYLTVLMGKTRKKIKGMEVIMDPVREHLEGKVYNQVNILTSNEGTYRDVNHLLLSYSSKNMVLKQQVADYS